MLSGYPRIRAPFLLIWGEEDIALGRELTYGLEPWFEHPPQVRYLPDVGHFVAAGGTRAGGLAADGVPRRARRPWPRPTESSTLRASWLGRGPVL